MSIDDLKPAWETMNEQGLQGHSEAEIEKIIGQGTSDVVKELNSKLFKEVMITAFAAMISIFGVIFFYAIYDPEKHSHIDPSKILPIQLLAFVIFLVLFLFGWFEYRLVNRQFTASSVSSFLKTLLSSLHKNYAFFTSLVLMLLLATFYLELDLFVGDSSIWQFKAGSASVLTALSYVGLRLYYQKSFGPYLANLKQFQEELKEG